MVIQLGTAIINNYGAVPSGAAVHVLAEEEPSAEIQEASTIHEELETYEEVGENNVLDLEKTLAEADKAIIETEELLNQHDLMQLKENEDITQEVAEENIVVASRGGHMEYKSNEKLPQYDLSDEEFNLMVQVVQAEAGGEPYEGQIAVANVIFNRVKAGWGATVTEVITQKGQFTKTRKKPSESVMNAVKEALYGRNAVPEGTLFFQNLEISTSFRIPRTKEYVTKIGQHTFYR